MKKGKWFWRLVTFVVWPFVSLLSVIFAMAAVAGVGILCYVGEKCSGCQDEELLS